MDGSRHGAQTQCYRGSGKVQDIGLSQSQGGVRCEERTYGVGPVYEMRLWNPVFYISSMCACFKFIHSFSTYLLGTYCMLNSRCWACSTESDQGFALRAFII